MYRTGILQMGMGRLLLVSFTGILPSPGERKSIPRASVMFGIAKRLLADLPRDLISHFAGSQDVRYTRRKNPNASFPETESPFLRISRSS